MAATKNTATGTLKGMDVRPTEMEQLAKEAAETAQKLLAAYSGPPEPSNVDIAAAYAPIEQAIRDIPAPTPLPEPSAPSGARLGLGLLATNLAAVAARNPRLAEAGLETAQNRILGREEVQRQNAANLSRMEAGRQLQLLQVRENVLTQKLNQEMENQKAAQADKTAKELFVVKSALDNVQARLKAREDASLSKDEMAARERMSNFDAKLRFLGQVFGDDGGGAAASGGMDAKDESNEIAKLNDFTTQIGLRIGPDGKAFWKEGKPTNEEMAAHIRVFNSYLSSPSQRVRAAALFDINNVLQEKFGNDQSAKVLFMVEQGLITKEQAESMLGR